MRVLVTGGCGFIGSNIADYYLKKGDDVTLIDNMSRKGIQFNLDWLKSNHGDKFNFVNADIREFDKIKDAVKDQETIFHTAAQVTMTDSLTDPRNDFEINALGTFNVLEAARLSNTNPIVAYTSTNKVYGDGANTLQMKEADTRWEIADEKFQKGIPESFSTDWDEHSPYGSSKYTADLYTRDYAHCFGLPTVTFRQSCIYGTRQFGKEEQGWIAHFVISSVLGKPIKIFGDGKQVRDTLFIDDLLNAFDSAVTNINKTKGQAFNMGGGSNFTVSLLELISMLEKMNNNKMNVSYHDWRAADQKIYISDISKAKEVFGWEPKVSPEEGVSKLNDWVKQNVNLFK